MDAQEKKILQSIWIIIGVGLFLTIALAVGLVTQVVNKQRAVITTTQASYLTQKAEADKLDEALVEKQKEEDKQGYVTGQLAFLRQRFRSLRFDALDPSQVKSATIPEDQKADLARANRNIAWRRWMNEYATGYGPALIRELKDAANDAHVDLKSGVKVGDPPRIPEEVIPPTNSLFRPTGGPLQISITGTLGNIMQFFNRVNESSILMLVNSDLKMTGYSPAITATFTITPYLLATGDGAPVAAGAAPAPAAGGSSGGGSGGYPGSSGGGYPGSGGGAAPAASEGGGGGAAPAPSAGGGGGLRNREPTVE